MCVCVCVQVCVCVCVRERVKWRRPSDREIGKRKKQKTASSREG